MEKVARVGVSMERELLAKLDEYVAAHRYPNRSHAIRDLVRKALVEQEWQAGDQAVAVVVLLFDHHAREISDRLREVQHDTRAQVLSNLHHHLSHDRCLEVITVAGSRGEICEVADQLRGTRGVLHSGFIVSSMGRHLP
ncbi:MAG: nickel-responsive transcriptional regulator NikR [Verrucomicrobia bacterium]|nr:nickel-responsive transcriptional regulator NikR [Verrucomicrobiota bacterium]